LTSLERIASAVFVAFVVIAASCADDAARPAYALAALPVAALAWAALYFRWFARHHQTVRVSPRESQPKCAVRNGPHRPQLVLTSLQASRLTPGHSDKTPVIYERVA
jgi:hypothetical protein